MHGTTNIKFIDHKQANVVHQFTNIKKKTYRTNAAIWYNKVCRLLRLTPAYLYQRLQLQFYALLMTGAIDALNM